MVVLQPLITLPCHIQLDESQQRDFNNVQYVYDPCRFKRYPQLLWLTAEECEFGRRLVWSVIFGCLIGWERRNADRPAGIRTMALVALGSCLFSICSAFAFLSGPMSWDSSRISAAIPSGVGFLGSALIFKHKDDNTSVHEVHGLTTAASVWLSAAVGIACAGGMYYISSLSCAIMLVLLRFGPRTNVPLQYEEEKESEEEEELGPELAEMGQTNPVTYQTAEFNPETQQLIPPRTSTSHSLRSEASQIQSLTPRHPYHRSERPSLM